MDEFQKVIEAMNEETYLRLRAAVEIGKWPNGNALSSQQRETSMQAVLAYEALHTVARDQTTGFVDTQNSDCHDDEGNHVGGADEATTLKWQK
ncbi:MAG: DUF1315 family protein [Pseudomonadales bacterium]|nr:DUF1315 family protein [Pseudomonadales bacterium]